MRVVSLVEEQARLCLKSVRTSVAFWPWTPVNVAPTHSRRYHQSSQRHDPAVGVAQKSHHVQPHITITRKRKPSSFKAYLSPKPKPIPRRSTDPPAAVSKNHPRSSTGHDKSRQISALKEFRPPPVPKPVLRNRELTLKRVRTAIQERFGEQYTVELFGSTCYGTDSATSDLDLLILDPDRPHGFDPSDTRKLSAIYNVTHISRVLTRCGFTDVSCVPQAAVPIVKAVDSVTGLSLDMNVNDRLGCANTRLIKRYCELAPHLPTVLYLLKSWAKPRGLNSPSTHGAPASFSSYALAIMTIGFFQMQGLLPNLQVGVEKMALTEDDFFWLRRIHAARGREVQHLKCEVRYHQGDEWIPRVSMSLEDILMGWFRYWGEQHVYDSSAMSIRRAGVFQRKDLLARQASPLELADYKELEAAVVVADISTAVATVHQSKEGANLTSEAENAAQDQSRTATTGEIQRWTAAPVCVEDPFIYLKNITTCIGHDMVKKFKKECRLALKRLKNGGSIAALLRKGIPDNVTAPRTAKAMAHRSRA